MGTKQEDAGIFVCTGDGGALDQLTDPRKETVPACTCGTLFSDGYVGPEDQNGCRLPVGHDGPHEFVAVSGELYQWETDWDCDCEHCMSGQGDFCTIYWRVESVAN